MADEAEATTEQQGQIVDVEDVIAKVIEQGKEGSDHLERKEEPPAGEEQPGETAPAKKDEPPRAAKPGEEQKEEDEALPPAAALRAFKAGMEAGDLGQMAKALGLKEDDLAAKLKADPSAFATLRRQTNAAKQQLENREQIVSQAEARIRSYLTSAESHIKAKEAYENGDFDEALKLAFGVEGANDFYKAHRAKVAGHDPRTTKLEKELREMRERAEKAERDKRQEELTRQEQEQVAAYIDTSIKAPMLESEHTGVATAAKHPRFCREVYEVLDERHRRSPFPDDLSFATALDEVSASVYAKNGWKELIESLSAPTGGSTRGAPGARKSESRSRNTATPNPAQDPELGPPEDESEEDFFKRHEKRIAASLPPLDSRSHGI